LRAVWLSCTSPTHSSSSLPFACAMRYSNGAEQYLGHWYLLGQHTSRTWDTSRTAHLSCCTETCMTHTACLPTARSCLSLLYLLDAEARLSRKANAMVP